MGRKTKEFKSERDLKRFQTKKLWREKNKEKIQKKLREWQKKNPDYYKLKYLKSKEVQMCEGHCAGCKMEDTCLKIALHIKLLSV